jgi:hypothetical protein
VGLFFGCAIAAFAQCPANLVTSAKGTRSADGAFRVDVQLASGLKHPAGQRTVNVDLKTIRLTLMKSNQELAGERVLRLAQAITDDDFEVVRLIFEEAYILPAGENEIQTKLLNLALECGTQDVTAQGKIVASAADLAAALETAKQNVEAATAHGNSEGDRNLFAGFAAVKGEGGEGAGAADILINQKFTSGGLKNGTLFDNAAVSLMVKKNSGANADPRAMHTGLVLTKVLHWGAAYRVRTRKNPTSGDATYLLNRNGWFRGMVIDEMLRMEGDASNFKTVNFVSDSQFVLPSVVKRIGDLGFYNFRLIGGPEFGKNMTSPDATNPAAVPKVDYIRRTKAGADLTLRWGESQITPGRFAVEMDLAYVNRWIHSPEPVLRDIVKEGKTVQELITIERGSRPWRQARVKVWLFGNEKIRYGISATYSSGSLPPSFAQTKAFQFGFVFETADDESSGETAHK